MLWMVGDSASEHRDNLGPREARRRCPVDSVDRSVRMKTPMSGTNTMSSTIHRHYYYDNRESKFL